MNWSVKLPVPKMKLFWPIRVGHGLNVQNIHVKHHITLPYLLFLLNPIDKHLLQAQTVMFVILAFKAYNYQSSFAEVVM